MNTSEQITLPSGDVTQLVTELSDYLQQLTSANSPNYYDVELFNADRDAVVVLRCNEKPMACGTIRFINSRTCEIKHMFTKNRESSHFGMSVELLHILENKAKLLGYATVILAIRRSKLEVLRLHLRHGYRRIRPCGKYRQKLDTICLGKNL